MRRSEILPWPTASWIAWCTRLTASSCKENRCAKNEAAKMARNEKHEESCGNGGAMESVESQKQASPSFHSPLEISPTAGEISTFPQLRRLRRGKVENQNQVSHFPTAISYVRKLNGIQAGFAPRPARRRFALAASDPNREQ